MRLKLFPTNFLFAITVLAPIFCGAQTVTHLQATHQGYLVVEVSINGSGPHSFLLDTGSNRTLVLNELLATLKISPGTVIAANMTTGVGYLHQTVASSVAVAGMAVDDLEVEGIDAAQLSRLGQSVEGVLGENFLKHFDFMIDNHAKTLTLDGASDLAYSLDGKRLPISFSGIQAGHPTADRLVLDLKLPSSSETTHFLIDSGANYALFFPTRSLPFQSRSALGGTVQSLGGTSRCRADVVDLKMGTETLSSIGLAYCQGMRSNVDVDGLLPTSTFKRLFISHSGAYAIVNPHVRKLSTGLPSRTSSGY